MCVCVFMNETHVEGCSVGVGSGVSVVSVDAWVTFSVPEETFPEREERTDLDSEKRKRRI